MRKVCGSGKRGLLCGKRGLLILLHTWGSLIICRTSSVSLTPSAGVTPANVPLHLRTQPPITLRILCTTACDLSRPEAPSQLLAARTPAARPSSMEKARDDRMPVSLLPPVVIAHIVKTQYSQTICYRTNTVVSHYLLSYGLVLHQKCCLLKVLT